MEAKYLLIAMSENIWGIFQLHPNYFRAAIEGKVAVAIDKLVKDMVFLYGLVLLVSFSINAERNRKRMEDARRFLAGSDSDSEAIHLIRAKHTNRIILKFNGYIFIKVFRMYAKRSGIDFFLSCVEDNSTFQGIAIGQKDLVLTNHIVCYGQQHQTKDSVNHATNDWVAQFCFSGHIAASALPLPSSLFYF